ncbi:MAG: hypothetical protein ACIPMY_07295 [Rickettsia endosymbiont of Pentastiridius leporinus]
MKDYATAENIYWNNYKENIKNISEVSSMYLAAAKASCRVSSKTWYKKFCDNCIERFGKENPKTIEILKLNCL